MFIYLRVHIGIYTALFVAVIIFSDSGPMSILLGVLPPPDSPLGQTGWAGRRAGPVLLGKIYIEYSKNQLW